MSKFSNRKKFIAASVAAAAVVTAVAPIASLAATTFPDENTFGNAKDAIYYLVDKGAIDGRSNGEFDAMAPITRGEAAKILAKALVSNGLTIDESAKADYADTTSHWASSFIAAIEKFNPAILNGVGGGNFAPDSNITRQEMAKMIVTAYGLELNENANVQFDDTDKWADWAVDSIGILASLGVVQGVEPGKFDPEATVTRAQTAIFIHRTEKEEARVEVPVKPVDPIVEPVVEAVTVVDATTLSVTFDNDETVEVTLSTPLTHGQSEVTFTIEGKEYTATLTEAYLDAEIVAEELAALVTEAENAVGALEANGYIVNTAEEQETFDGLVEDAQEAIDALPADSTEEGAETPKADLQAIVDQLVVLNNGYVTKVKPVFDAVSDDLELFEALSAFDNVNVDNIDAYAAAITDIKDAVTTVAEIQYEVDYVNARVAVDALVATSKADLTQEKIDSTKAIVEVLPDEEDAETKEPVPGLDEANFLEQIAAIQAAFDLAHQVEQQ